MASTLQSIKSTTRFISLILLATLLRISIRTITVLLGVKIDPHPDSVEYITIRTIKPNTKKTTTHKIKLHIYNPPNTTTTNPNPPPVLITFCGSGFVIPGFGLDDPYCRHISTETAHIVIDVQYRLSPEHPFPAALEDAQAVVSWVLKHPDRFNTRRISLGGFSAGGNVATSLAVNDIFPPGTFHALIAFYPVVDVSVSPWEKRAITPGRPKEGGLGSISPGVLGFFQACYLFGCEEGEGIVGDCRVSPALAGVERFPGKCLFVTAEFDFLGPEVERLVGMLREGDGLGERKVVLFRAIGCGHAFDKGAKEGTERWRMKEEAFRLAVGMLKGGP